MSPYSACPLLGCSSQVVSRELGTTSVWHVHLRYRSTRRQLGAMMGQKFRKGRCTHCRGATCVFRKEGKVTAFLRSRGSEITEDSSERELHVRKVTAGETASSLPMGLVTDERLNPKAKPFRPKTRPDPMSKRTKRTFRRAQIWRRLFVVRLKALNRAVILDALEGLRDGPVSIRGLWREWGRNAAEFIEYELWLPYSSQDGIFRDTVVHACSIEAARYLSPFAKANLPDAMQEDHDLLEDLTGERIWESFLMKFHVGEGMRKDRKPPLLRRLAEGYYARLVSAQEARGGPDIHDYYREVAGTALDDPEDEWESDDDESDDFPLQEQSRWYYGDLDSDLDEGYSNWQYR